MAWPELHPTLREWFEERFGEPTPPQRRAWPHIRAGHHTLIAAPTGSGKTLAAFLSAIDALLRCGPELPDETRILYVSPLKALSNDIQKNLQEPLRELRQRNLFLPEIRVLVRTGDTLQAERAAMARKPPHILVTTPESLYLLLTSAGGRRMLRTVRVAIIDEIHALARDKRGAHLALSLERLEALIQKDPGRHAGSPDDLLAAGLTGSARPAAAQRTGDLPPGSPAPSGFQRIGLSATQKPLEEIARFLVGAGRECVTVDAGQQRELDLAVEVPASPLSAVCSHETWSEIYERMVELIREHRTTLVFVNTRKLAERLAARLTERLGPQQVTCHHGSLSRERRLDAEQRLKQGKLKALVATASLELGIDIGQVDLAILVGAPRCIATALQRVGRAGHSLRRVPKGRLFPLTLDELVEAAALLRAIRGGVLDRTIQPACPRDILAQQIVAACALESWGEQELYETFRRAWPYRDLAREDFDAVVALHTHGRRGLLHRDGVNGRLRGRRRARITAVTCGGAIPDTADYRVVQEPDGVYVGSLNEDFAVESNVGDIFQLGNTSWRVLKVEPGVVRVADAAGQPPTLPFWLGEAPGRTAELSAEVGRLREAATSVEELMAPGGLSLAAARQIVEYLSATRRALGTVPTHQRIVAERFFDESGGMQLVLHAPLGTRINRAWGLALRKRFCRGFGFELQAAATDEAIVISLAAQHSFPLESVFDFLHPASARDVLIQALLNQPMFESRWRWNLTRSLLLERQHGGRRVPPALLRMRAADMLAAAFPQVVACPENLPGGELPVPMDHPMVRQTVEDCLHEAMDIDGLLELLRGLRDGSIQRVAIDTVEPSPMAAGILAAHPYSFLDDAPLEERRTQAVMQRRTLDVRTADDLGALDPQAVRQVRRQAWPCPESAEEVHEALLWMGFITAQEAHDPRVDDEPVGPSWEGWLAELRAAGRVRREADTWMAVEASRDPREVVRGRLEALGPVFAEDPGAARLLPESMLPGDPRERAARVRELLVELEAQGLVLRTRLGGRQAWCERRLLARIHRCTLEHLRAEIQPVSAGDFLRFLACWQHVEPEYRLEGPQGVLAVVRQLAGYEVPAGLWESAILPARVRDYRREWLDELTLLGEIAWGRLWGAGATPVRSTPICLLPREDLAMWVDLAGPACPGRLPGPALEILEALAARGAMFVQELQRTADLLPAHLETGLAALIAAGLVTCDSFAGLRQLIVPPSRRTRRIRPTGRWSLLRHDPWDGLRGGAPAGPGTSYPPGVHADRRGPSRIAGAERYPRIAAGHPHGPDAVAPGEFLARQMLQRTGVVFRRVLLREKLPVTWYELLRACRRLELRGEVRGGRFVAGMAGEQYALPEAVELLRAVRRAGPRPPLLVPAADPLNFQGILTPEPRVASTTRARVRVG